MRRHTLARLLAYALLGCALAPNAAYSAATVPARQTARLHVTLTPDVPGQSTSVAFDLAIDARPGHVPPPLTRLDLDYPSDLGLALSGLGLATCSRSTLEQIGPAGCPADSRMGQGSALAELQVGGEITTETAVVTIVRAPEEEGRIAMLFNVDAYTPVSAEVILAGALLPAPTPAAESIDIEVPLVEGLPGGADVAVVRLDATFGPRGLVYYERVHGKLVRYTPKGILLPRRCPRAGFHFAATLTFLGGASAVAQTLVPC
jgi:hypothetical protein